MVAINNASAAIQWAVIRKNSAFLHKRRNVKKFFSLDKFNTTGHYTNHASGLSNDAGVSVRLDGKKLIVDVKKKSSGAAHKPVSAVTTTVFTGGPRRVVKKVGALVKSYEGSLAKSAKNRAYKLLRSTRQRKPSKKGKSSA